MTDPIADPPAAATIAAEPPRDLRLTFGGSAREYFRIWIVNLCLTLVTLGIFSAWAKVRKKRYFYSYTTLDGTPFQYLAQPLPILKGRLIALALFLVYYVSSNFYRPAFPYVLGAAAVLAPWVIVRSAAFKARYSAYRNMTFLFDGNYWGAFKTIYWVGLVAAMIGGALYAAWGWPAALGGAVVVISLLLPWWVSRFHRFIVGHTAYGGRNGSLAVTGAQFFAIYLLAGLIVGAGGLVGTVLMVVIGRFATAAAPSAGQTLTAIWALMVPAYGAYVVSYAYIQARANNLVWNRIQLGPVRFRSTLPVMGLAGLYLTNALGIIVSVGLLTPWAVIRTIKYRVDHMQVFAAGDLTQFVGSAASSVQAAGAELGEFFDLDLSL